MTYPQQIAMLHHATRAVFRPEVPMPEFAAVVDGAVGAIFQNMRWAAGEGNRNQALTLPRNGGRGDGTIYPVARRLASNDSGLW